MAIGLSFWMHVCLSDKWLKCRKPFPSLPSPSVFSGLCLSILLMLSLVSDWLQILEGTFVLRSTIQLLYFFKMFIALKYYCLFFPLIVMGKCFCDRHKIIVFFLAPELPVYERRNWLIHLQFIGKEFENCKVRKVYKLTLTLDLWSV